MASLNKVIIIGNLGTDPELRYALSGQAVVSFSVATTDKFLNRSEQMEKRTEWHSILIYGRLAEVAGENLHKGSTVFLEGRLQTRKWQDKNNNDRYSTEIVCDHLQILHNKPTSKVDQNALIKGGNINDSNCADSYVTGQSV